MEMFKPPHPGGFILATYMEPYGISCRYLADKLCVSASTLSRLLKGQSRINPEMALRLSKSIGRSPESWLAMQDKYDLSVVRRNVKLENVKPLALEEANASIRA